MILEDFFTLSEMKDGFSSITRVEELMSSLLKLGNCTVSTVVDAVRQWSAVARIIIATEDNRCLVRFLELDGLFFLNQWLRDAVRFEPKASDNAMQELINLLLRALQKLPVNKERLPEIGIDETVKEVLSVRYSDSLEIANELLAHWKLSDNEGLDCDINGNGDDEGLLAEIMSSNHSVFDISLSKLSGGNAVLEHTKTSSPIPNIDTCPVAEVGIMDKTGVPERCSLSGQASTSCEAFVSCNVSSLVYSDMPNSSQEVPANAEHRSDHEILIAAEHRVCTDVDIPSSSLDATRFYVSCGPKSLEEKAFSEVSKEMEILIEENTNNHNSTADSPAHSGAVSDECKQGDNEVDGLDTLAESKPLSSISTIAAGDLTCLQKEKELESHYEEKPLNECFHKMNATGSENKNESTDESSSDESDDTSNVQVGLSCMLDWKGKDSRDSSHHSERANSSETDTRSELRFDFGDDALEFAVRVAIQAQHEVADREQCSSPTESSESSEEKSSDIKTCKSFLGDVSSQNKSTLETMEKMDDACVHEPKMESPLSNLLGQEHVENAENKKCIFDLNEVVCSEDMDNLDIPWSSNLNNLSAPVAVVALSKGPPVLPGASLHFEGELGWRGTAATSAFRPASSRTPDSEKTLSVSKEKSKVFIIDLNLLDEEDETKTNSILDPALSSVLLPGDSFVHFNSARVEKLNLDLNQLGEEDSQPSSSSRHLFSLSSSIQFETRNFDLNDNPPLPEASPLTLNRSAGECNQKRLKPDDSVVTLMGSRFSVDQKGPTSLIHPALAHGSHVAVPTPPRTSAFLSHLGLPSHGYNGQVMPQTQYLPSLYGPGTVPYVVDSRGAIVVPQLFAGSMDMNGPFTPALPFPGNLGSSHLNLVGDGTLRQSQNTSAELTLDGGNRELGAFRQLYMPGGHSFLSQEQTRASSPSTFGAGLPLKRKEPDPGWDCSTFGYKQVTSWH